MLQLFTEISGIVAKHNAIVGDEQIGRNGKTIRYKKFAVRLNGTSDIIWESIATDNGMNIFERFPSVQFYDYTAILNRAAILDSKWSNYHLTFSRKETKPNQRDAEKALAMQVNVAAVYSNLDKALQNKDTVNGDLHDLRFLDIKGKIVALKAKGDAKKGLSGFVIHN